MIADTKTLTGNMRGKEYEMSEGHDGEEGEGEDEEGEGDGGEAEGGGGGDGGEEVIVL